MNFWQGKLVRLRGVEPSDAEAFARWTNKAREAEVFLHWLMGRLNEAALEPYEETEGGGPGTLP